MALTAGEHSDTRGGAAHLADFQALSLQALEQALRGCLLEHSVELFALTTRLGPASRAAARVGRLQAGRAGVCQPVSVQRVRSRRGQLKQRAAAHVKPTIATPVCPPDSLMSSPSNAPGPSFVTDFSLPGAKAV